MEFIKEKGGMSEPLKLTPKEAFWELEKADERNRARLLENYTITRAAQHADKKADEKLRKSLQ